MYALLDFGSLRIEQRTKFSQVKSYYQGKLVDDYHKYCDEEYLDSINNFFKGIIEDEAFLRCDLINIIIPDSVTSIGDSAFYSCTNLISVIIPDGVTSIGDSAFYYCTSLTSVIVADSVTSIGNYAFNNCTSLTSVTIPDGVTSIGYGAFYNVSHIYYNGTATGSPWGALAIN